MTELIRDPKELFARCEAARQRGVRIGFVPTMGALHAGHMSLIEECQRRGATLRVMSIFVNPLQFGANEDLSRYPRTLDADLALCAQHGVDWVYLPAVETMYPRGFQTHVEVTELTTRFEGAHRPTHFRGVTTVVAKLFCAVGPCTAVFGRKDYQQWKAIGRMVEDLHLPIEVIGAPIVREADGLAMSSRNRYISGDVRQRAGAIAEGLRRAFDAHAQGERRPDVLAARVRERVESTFDSVDYIEAADPDTLAPLAGPSERMVLLAAARIGGTRLIDNLELGHDARP